MLLATQQYITLQRRKRETHENNDILAFKTMTFTACKLGALCIWNMYPRLHLQKCVVQWTKIVWLNHLALMMFKSGGHVFWPLFTPKTWAAGFRRGRGIGCGEGAAGGAVVWVFLAEEDPGDAGWRRLISQLSWLIRPSLDIIHKPCRIYKVMSPDTFPSFILSSGPADVEKPGFLIKQIMISDEVMLSEEGVREPMLIWEMLGWWDSGRTTLPIMLHSVKWTV